MERYEQRIKLREDTNAPFGAGAFIHGNVMIVGEQDSDPSANKHQMPFCTNKGCTGWLNKQLDAANIPEEKLFWVNSLHNDGSEANIDHLVTFMKPSAVLVLGGIARRICRKQGIEFTPFYHPQYWKRFRSREKYALIDKLKGLTC